MKPQLEALQKRIYAQQYKSAESYVADGQTVDDSEFEHILFVENNDLYKIHFYGDGYDHFYHNPEQWQSYEEEFNDEEEGFSYESSAFSELIDLIITHPEKIQRLTFNGPPYGANGTRAWDFSRLEAADVVFPNLRIFKVELYKSGAHNGIIIGEHHEPNTAQVSNILLKMPNVNEVEIPSVPDAQFFKADFPQLSSLTVQAGYDHFNFIKNLAVSALLHQVSIDYTDCLYEDSMNEEEQQAEQEYLNELEADLEAEKKQFEQLIEQGMSRVQAAVELQKREMLEDADSLEEINILFDFHLTRDQTAALLKKVFPDPEDVAIELGSYEMENRWLNDGSPNPDYIQEQESIYLAIYDDDNKMFDITVPDVSETSMKRTPFEDYVALFRAIKKGSNMAFWLRENYLTKKELKQLATINPTVQFKHIPTGGDRYVENT